MEQEWKTWKVGMEFYIPYEKVIQEEKGIACPICKGQGKLIEPFTKELYSCPGVVIKHSLRYQCINGKIYPLTTLYQFKKYELENFTVKYPDEKLKSVSLKKYDEDWLDEPSSTVHFSHKVNEMYFFKTKKEAQEYCDKMNQKMENKK